MVQLSEPKRQSRVKTALRSTSPVSFADIESSPGVRHFKRRHKSSAQHPFPKKIPSANGQNPTLLYGYGGYGISMSPNFDFIRRLWFDRGGIYVVANIRGGGRVRRRMAQGR